MSTTLDRAAHLAKAREARVPILHLYRGAPAVRAWSKYQTTDTRHTLCGIPIKARRSEAETDTRAIDRTDLVNCTFCKQLLS